MENYHIEYNQFMEKYKENKVAVVDVGEMVARLTGYFASYNLDFAHAKIAFNHCVSVIQNRSDESTGKSITSAKAEIMSRATPESDAAIITETHVKNLDMMIQSLKKLQDGLAREFLNAT